MLSRFFLVTAAVIFLSVSFFHGVASAADSSGLHRSFLKSIGEIRTIEEGAVTKADYMKVASEYRKLIFKFQSRSMAPTLAIVHSKLADILFDKLSDPVAGLKELYRITELYPDTPEGIRAFNRIYSAYEKLEKQEARNRNLGTTDQAGNVVRAPGIFNDRDARIILNYNPFLWVRDMDPTMDPSTRLMLNRAMEAPASSRKMSVIVVPCEYPGSAAHYAAAAFVAMQKIPDIISMKSLTFRELDAGGIHFYIRNARVVTAEGPSVLYQAVGEVNDHIVTLTINDEVANLFSAGKEFYEILNTIMTY
ncbi:MAG: hypothetical protein CVV64_15940 [Candidatus Wallbacteria bacterium HGW-Wallbacteria-1]|jgi:hypothetical protein|uniref:Uncharacterized protein n=1 Tax=Candidatus Wallbacteria bacterium HGW-Wallbacteria-1 TaxID=2013854 RepID=A0A2N1PLB1_9BACT|nr:MAG: hypothetical protein CVV64_15940 [Candidatus Wallbacteria bacterium HGW-Wallbacteria-1]